MKKVVFLVVLILSLTSIPLAFAEESKPDITTSAKSAYLLVGDEEVYESNSDERYPIASMVKMMTTLLAFEEIEKGNLSMDEKIMISQTAMGMGGSQMFLEEGLEYPLSDLLKGIIVVSANDASVALAERISGTEQAFVNKMNKKAEELNMTNTNYVNCTGLPQIGGYSSARDSAILLSNLIKYDDYHKFSTIWLEDYHHPDGRVTTFTNTNKMIRFYNGCDGGKTGFTNEAGFCLSVTAERDGLRAISVVIGEKDSKTRFEDSKKLLNYAFASYKKQILAKNGEMVGELSVTGGKAAVPITVKNDIGVYTQKGQNADSKLVIEIDKSLKAPLSKGSVVGYALSIKNGKEVERSELITMQNLDKSTYGDAINRVFGNW